MKIPVVQTWKESLDLFKKSFKNVWWIESVWILFIALMFAGFLFGLPHPGYAGVHVAYFITAVVLAFVSHILVRAVVLVRMRSIAQGHPVMECKKVRAVVRPRILPMVLANTLLVTLLIVSVVLMLLPVPFIHNSMNFMMLANGFKLLLGGSYLIGSIGLCVWSIFMFYAVAYIPFILFDDAGVWSGLKASCHRTRRSWWRTFFTFAVPQLVFKLISFALLLFVTFISVVSNVKSGGELSIQSLFQQTSGHVTAHILISVGCWIVFVVFMRAVLLCFFERLRKQDVTEVEAWLQNPFHTFWQRTTAFLIDGLLLVLAFMAVALFHPHLSLYWIAPVMLLYFGILESGKGGACSLGKRLLRLRVMARTGDPLAVWRSFLRVLLWLVPLVILVFYHTESHFPGGIAGLVVKNFVWGAVLGSCYLYLFNLRNRGALHDLLCRTIVVRSRIPYDAATFEKTNRGHIVVVCLLVFAMLLVGGYGSRTTQTTQYSAEASVQRLQQDHDAFFMTHQRMQQRRVLRRRPVKPVR